MTNTLLNFARLAAPHAISNKMFLKAIHLSSYVVSNIYFSFLPCDPYQAFDVELFDPGVG